MSARRQYAAVLLVLTVFAAGCKKKPKTAKLPPAPSVTTQATAVPSPPPAAAASPEPPKSQPDSNTAPPAKPSVQKPKPRPRRVTAAKKPAAGVAQPSTSAPSGSATAPPSTEPPATVARNAPPRIVIDGGATPGGQISMGMPHDESAHKRQTTEQLIDSTETNLRGLNRDLSEGEQAMLGQIRSYLAQARAAEREGDRVRAYNLALKAHLLSDELVGH